jgi:hypothetical protein
LQEEIEQQGAGLVQDRAPSGSETRVREISAFGRSQGVERDTQLAHVALVFVID